MGNAKTKEENFTAKLLVPETPRDVFNAIVDVQGWWSEGIEGSADELHAEFIQRYQDMHIAKMRIIEFIPFQKITWLVLDSHLSFTDNKSEWTNTTICFAISKKGKQTQLIFTHIGLVPQQQCYSVCHDAWNDLINRSLRGLITTGKGRPNPKEVRPPEAEGSIRWKLYR